MGVSGGVGEGQVKQCIEADWALLDVFVWDGECKRCGVETRGSWNGMLGVVTQMIVEVRGGADLRL
jgi:hypothetical protein